MIETPRIPDYRRLADRVRERRLAAQLTREQLARLLDVSPHFVRHLENGDRRSGAVARFILLASALNIPLDELAAELFGGELPSVPMQAGKDTPA